MDKCSSDIAKDVVKSELEVLKNEPHWKKAYFYLWDEARISTCPQYGCGSRTSFKVIYNFVVDRQIESRLIMLDDFMSMFLLSLEIHSLLLREQCWVKC